jgi:DcaP outer membrane protein
MVRPRMLHLRYITLLVLGAALGALLPAGSAHAQLADTTFTWGGYVKLDMIYSTSSPGAESSVVDFILVPGSVPVNNPADQRNYHLSARESRVWLKTSTPSPLGNVDAHVELDFLGIDASLGSEVSSNASSLRLRHAFGTWNMVWGGQPQGALLAGQTWTTIMDLDALPDIIDFGSPAGRVFGQQSQIRYTRDLGGGAEMQVALENPENTLRIDNPADPVVPGDAQGHGALLSPRPGDDLAPDTIAKYRLAGSWGHVAASGIARLVRQARVTGFARTDTDFAYGVHLSGKLTVGEKHNLRFDGSYGHGLGRYLVFGAFPDGEVEADGNVEPTNIAGTIVSGQVWLSETTRINLAFSYARALNNAETLGGIANETLLTTHANVMWNPTKSLRLGIEHIYAQRSLEDDGTTATAEELTGDMHRIQGAFRFQF